MEWKGGLEIEIEIEGLVQIKSVTKIN